MRKAIIKKIIIEIGERKVELDHEEAKAIYECLKEMFPSTSNSVSWPIVIYHDYPHWTPPNFDWVGPIQTSGHYNVDNETLTLSLGSATLLDTQSPPQPEIKKPKAEKEKPNKAAKKKSDKDNPYTALKEKSKSIVGGDTDADL